MSGVNTIKVMYKPGKYEMVINEDDFDDKIHEKINEKPAEVEKPAKGKKAEAKNIDDEVKALIGEE
ncbi:MAG: hypothetical protein IJ529_02225 [Alphaproteobacteria bacterium]|nr:hypothetical protein [Alphaproteobacteria bacterium]MBR1599972.1 hypothetical protein [Alphaproteobacteria bacterium]